MHSPLFFLASSLQPSHFAQLGTPLIFHSTYLLLYFTLIFACLPFIFVQNFPFDQKWRAMSTAFCFRHWACVPDSLLAPSRENLTSPTTRRNCTVPLVATHSMNEQPAGDQICDGECLHYCTSMYIVPPTSKLLIPCGDQKTS